MASYPKAINHSFGLEIDRLQVANDQENINDWLREDAMDSRAADVMNRYRKFSKGDANPLRFGGELILPTGIVRND